MLSRGPALEAKQDIEIKQKNGAPGTIRTCDLCLRRAALYPAELRVPPKGPDTLVQRGGQGAVADLTRLGLVLF